MNKERLILTCLVDSEDTVEFSQGRLGKGDGHPVIGITTNESGLFITVADATALRDWLNEVLS